MKRIENLQARNILFAKKRKEIEKMAARLSKLANIDIHFFTVSPSGRPYVSSATCSERSPSFDQVVERLLKDHHSTPPPPPPLPLPSSASTSTSSSSGIDFQKTEPAEIEKSDKEMMESVLNVDISNMTLSEVQEYKKYLLELKSKVLDAVEKKRGFEDRIGGVEVEVEVEGEGSFVKKDEMISSDRVITDLAVFKGATDEIADGIEHEQKKMVMNNSIDSDGESDEDGSEDSEFDDDDDESEDDDEEGDEI